MSNTVLVIENDVELQAIRAAVDFVRDDEEIDERICPGAGEALDAISQRLAK